MAFPADYTLLGDLEFPSVTGSHADFVALIKYDDLTASMLASIDDGGGDLRFSSDAAGASQLPCEVVEFDKVGNSVQVWVKVPTAATSSKVYIWGNNAGDSQPAVTDPFGRNAVWSDYELVILSGGVIDSTGKHSPFAVGSPSLASLTNGQDGYDLDDNTKWIQIPNSPSLNIEKNYSLDVWMNRSGAALEGTSYVEKVNASNTNGFRFLAGGDNDLRTRHPNLNPSNLNANGTNTAAGLLVLSSDMDGTTRRNLINGTGASFDTPSGSVINVSDDLYIGHSLAITTDSFKAVLGDFFLRKNSVALNQKLTEYQNQSAVGAYFIATDASGGNTSTVNVTAKKPTVQIQASATVPQPNAVIAVTAKKPTVLINASATTPSTTANISITAKKPTVNIEAAASLPQPDSVVSITAKKPTVSIDAEVITQLPNANISITAKKPTVAITGGVTIPAPIASVSVTAKKPVVMIRATMSGLIIVPPKDAQLIYKPGSNELIYKPGSNELIYKN